MNTKKFLSFLLAFTLLMSCCPMAVAATIVESGSCGAQGDNVTWTLDSNGVLTFSGTGEMAGTVRPSDKASITSVVIEEGVTSLTYGLFRDFTALKSVKIPSSLNYLPGGDFMYCTSLESIEVAENHPRLTSVDGVLVDEYNGFLHCYPAAKQGTKFIVPDSVSTIDSYAFYNCKFLTDIDLNRANVIYNEAFAKCTSLTRIVIPASVGLFMVSVFDGCTNLKDIIFEGNAKDFMDATFYGVNATCYYPADNTTWANTIGNDYGGDLTWKPYYGGTWGGNIKWNLFEDGSLSISGSGAMQMAGPGSTPQWLDYRSAIKSVVVEEGVTSLCFQAISAMTNLTTVSLPNSLTTIDEQALVENNFTTITIPANVTSIGSQAFYGCGKLSSITFVGDAPSIGDGAFYGVNATCYYPADNETWANTIDNNYGGTLEWKPYGNEPYSLSFTPAATTISKGESVTLSLVLDSKISVLAGTVTVSATDSSGNELEITKITPNSITGCQIDYEGSKILIATEGTIAAGTKIADISFATNADTNAEDYTVTLVSDLYTGDMDSDKNDQKLDFAVNEGTISVSEVPVTVTWKNEDGTVLETDEKVAYGDTPEYNGSIPQKSSTVQYTYTFNGWSPTVGAVTEDTIYTATYTETLRSYTLTFKNESGTTLETLTVPYGTEPEAIEGIPAVPAKEATAEYSYTANDWGVQKVTGDATYTASYTASKNSYTITWKDADGSTIDTTTVEYGQTPTHAAPSKPDDVGYTYSFSKWNPTPSVVTGTATYQAVYSSTARTYTVSVAGIVDGAVFVLKDSGNSVVEPVDGKYSLTYDQTYFYTINAVGYKPVESSFTVSSENTAFAFNSGAGTADLTLAAMEKFIGDLNNDDDITIVDAQALYNYILGRYTLNGEGMAYNGDQLVFNLNVADINGNGVVGADDILPMLRLINQNG